MQTLESPSFEVSLYATPDVTFVLLAGDLDVASAPRLIDTVERELGSPNEVVFDLASLEFLDVAGARALVRAVDRVRSTGSLAVVVSPSRPVDRILRLLGVDAHLGVETNGMPRRHRSRPFTGLRVTQGAPAPERLLPDGDIGGSDGTGRRRTDREVSLCTTSSSSPPQI